MPSLGSGVVAVSGFLSRVHKSFPESIHSPLPALHPFYFSFGLPIYTAIYNDNEYKQYVQS